ncbi:hypothetical protein [Streptomyces sp. NPDC004232]|uniref:hypothetical protein n=1 Tax=unclassified Streptomyces TaxID=2593676 RepID=UPI0033B5074F
MARRICIAAVRETSRPIWEASSDADVLRQFLNGNGIRGVEAVFVTTGLLSCDLAEAQRAFFSVPWRDDERRFHSDALGLLAEDAADDA